MSKKFINSPILITIELMQFSQCYLSYLEEKLKFLQKSLKYFITNIISKTFMMCIYCLSQNYWLKLVVVIYLFYKLTNHLTNLTHFSMRIAYILPILFILMSIQNIVWFFLFFSHLLTTTQLIPDFIHFFNRKLRLNVFFIFTWNLLFQFLVKKFLWLLLLFNTLP